VRKYLQGGRRSELKETGGQPAVAAKGHAMAVAHDREERKKREKEKRERRKKPHADSS
jgi:hypothetical protein